MGGKMMWGNSQKLGEIRRNCIVHEGGWCTVACCDCMLRLFCFYHFLLIRSGLLSWALNCSLRRFIRTAIAL